MYLCTFYLLCAACIGIGIAGHHSFLIANQYLYSNLYFYSFVCLHILSCKHCLYRHYHSKTGLQMRGGGELAYIIDPLSFEKSCDKKGEGGGLLTLVGRQRYARSSDGKSHWSKVIGFRGSLAYIRARPSQTLVFKEKSGWQEMGGKNWRKKRRTRSVGTQMYAGAHAMANHILIKSDRLFIRTQRPVENFAWINNNIHIS